MDFMEAVKTVLTKKYVKFSGRACRSEYWWFQLFSFIVSVVTALIALAFIMPFDIYSQEQMAAFLIKIYSIVAIPALLLFLPQLSVQVRRFHDRNISGWWLLLFYILNFVPFVNFVAFIVMLVITVQKGTDGSNRFGRDPLGPDIATEVFA